MSFAIDFLFVIKQPVFTIAQLNRLSSIFDNAGQVIFGVAVLAPMIGGFDKINPKVLILGSIGVMSCWLASLWFAKKAQ